MSSPLSGRLMRESGSAGDPSGDVWRALRLFSLYRFFVAGMLTALEVFGTGPHALGSSHPRLFLLFAVTYLLLSLGFGIAARLRRSPPSLQIYLQAATDISLITLLTYTSGGVSSGLGMLAIPAIAGLGLLAPGRPALLFAALASIALLLAQIHGYWFEPGRESALTQTGLLGAGLFATALLALVLAHRARESEDLAQRRSVDLANMAELNAHIIDRMQSGVIVVNDDRHVHLINESAWLLLGNPVTADTSDLSRLAPDLFHALQEWLRHPARAGHRTLPAGDHSPELRIRFTRLGVDKPIGTVILLEDTAELRRQMQSIKLASLGRLTASIAHEIRNPLGAISHAAQLLDESIELNRADRRLVGIIQDQSRRMNQVIQNVLDLSRRQAPRIEALALEPWLERFADEFCRHHNLARSQVELSIHPADARAWFDAEQLHQVTWNLCTNALRYGTRAGQPARILIQGGTRDVSRHATLDIIDQGCGVNPAIARRLFEPFVGTGNEGTGLGLYISRELCENNGGSLDYIPLPTGGSCFRIQFPPSETTGSGLQGRLSQQA
ncbi:sensor histidine kinase [Ectothiorhodospira lacustris]|uniref:sensor histidine kinase n=1 Tax=Ectothiorhodospira lacustris TaxID=2899127 RepID=UPI001EE807FC|nr:ATP-binding protein [Ectothiorhodospira lacustris]MCG5501006.1 ATP-binding protein [Ectothiorhodospira lacustris]MCG5510558.1 ATP-binding protein [Ectothiorhodospira lacustris]MCG5521250.1 ATP-binding protein [Ectothiorhodospira lacustris]